MRTLKYIVVTDVYILGNMRPFDMHYIEIMLDMLITMTYKMTFSNIYGV